MIKGLSENEIKNRVLEGKTNKTNIKHISIFSIVQKHTITLFNILNIFFALACILVGEAKNAIFIVIAILNTVIAIVNDIRAKYAVEKLTLLSSENATVIRDGEEKRIDNSEIVLDDILKYNLGNQIVVDGEIIDGFVEVNESFVTGESNTIRKNIGDKLISGSFVIAGSCLAKTTAVGEESFTNNLLKSAKLIKSDTSVLFETLNKIVRYISYALVPIGGLLFYNQLNLENATIATATTSTVSALLSMIPEGLMLLTSSVLALATIRLAKKKVLVSDLYSIETLARVDTICLDKTGTLTTGNLKVEKFIPKDGTLSELKASIGLILGALNDNNSTYNALAKKIKKIQSEDVEKKIPFSSDRKYSGVALKNREIYMGAYEFIPKLSEKSNKFFSEEQKLSENSRVITVIERKNSTEKVLGFVLLSDEIRKNAKHFLEYLKKEEVKVKIISGDNLGTIEKICKTIGYSGKSIDLSNFFGKTFDEIVEKYDIFARVRPEQKKELVKSLEKAGHKVAMTGDGVNDVLALKEADCGISIGAGADAARRVARLVLLDNDFDVIPEIIKEGRQTINNVTRSSTLFLSKTIYASILSIVFIFLNYRYPFIPIEMSLINFVLIGAPSFILALETNTSRPSSNFRKNILRHSLPASIAMIFSVITLAINSDVHNLTEIETTTISCVVAMFIGFLLIYKISRPLNKLRGGLLLGLILVVILAFALPTARSIFSLTIPSTEVLGILTKILLVSFLIFLTSALITRRIEKEN